MNVCFGQDSIKDPWYPLGNGNILRILDAGLHICHMMGYQDLQRCLDFVTDNSAKALHLAIATARRRPPSQPADSGGGKRLRRGAAPSQSAPVDTPRKDHHAT